MNFENMSKEELIEYINNLNEEHSGKYGLVWDAEKVPEQVVVDCNKLIPVLKEEENKKIDNGGEDNILIEGDNFHSLSVLNYTHKEAIDVIYIDPPYNTGNKDFMYNDIFIDIEDGYRHSKWLNFMSKRFILKNFKIKTCQPPIVRIFLYFDRFLRKNFVYQWFYNLICFREIRG